MTNREAFLEGIQRQVDRFKEMSDSDLAACADLDCHDHLRRFAASRGTYWEPVKFGYPVPPGQHARIVAWLREEAKDD